LHTARPVPKDSTGKIAMATDVSVAME